MRYILLFLLVIPVFTMAQKAKSIDTQILGNWDRDRMPNEDFFTHFEFSDDSNCLMNKHYGHVHAMSYGQKEAKWSLNNRSIIINAENAKKEKVSYSFVYKISEEKSMDEENTSPILKLELKNIKTGKKYIFYKIAA